MIQLWVSIRTSPTQHKLERLWIISLLKEGLRSDCDYPVYRKRNVIPILMTHYNSLLTDSSMKVYCFDCTAICYCLFSYRYCCL